MICGLGKTLGRRISTSAIYQVYSNYREKVFPKILDNPSVSPEDKQKIKELLKKPWNPYIRRHSALTEKSTILKEHVLRQHAGWSIGSQMPQKYLHYFGNESSESLPNPWDYDYPHIAKEKVLELSSELYNRLLGGLADTTISILLHRHTITFYYYTGIY